MKSIQQRLLTYLLIGLPVLWLTASGFTTWRIWHEIEEMNDTQIVQVTRYLLETSRATELEETVFNRQNNANNSTNISETSSLTRAPLPPEITGHLGHAKDDYMGYAVWDMSGRLLMADQNGQFFKFLPNQHGFLEKEQLSTSSKESQYPNKNSLNSDSQTQRWRVFYVHDDYADSASNNSISSNSVSNNLNSSNVSNKENLGHIIAVGQNLASRHEIIINAIVDQVIPMILGLLAFVMLLIWAVRQGFAPLRQISVNLKARALSDTQPIDTDVPIEVQTLVTALDELFIKVANTLEREQRFTADASHELRSPLTAVKLQVDLLQQQLLQRFEFNEDERVFYHTQKISEGIDRANHLVEQLLILAKLAPQQHLPSEQLEPANWIKLTDDVLNDINRQAREKYIKLKRTLAIDINAGQDGAKQILAININPTLIHILLRNLLDNAIRYSPENSVVEIILNTDSIIIRDNGKGVDPEHLSRLSERFYRLAGQKQKGSGLGLSIVSQIADLHQLKVDFSNRTAPDSGLIVTISKRAI
ncbi:ATP-binding protein [Psychrobacter sanguinis]|uniref:histidine kinase n=1 Tax=Psychrobacter sanguinis TaxID=861445 RepID=A0A844LX72_9GAMM|nr:ATP-binding protein [Psychrobacter sanguinis]MUG31409.1 histidine kinase [Psychrobacter sanguinis]